MPQGTGCPTTEFNSTDEHTQIKSFAWLHGPVDGGGGAGGGQGINPAPGLGELWLIDAGFTLEAFITDSTTPDTLEGPEIPGNEFPHAAHVGLAA